MFGKRWIRHFIFWLACLLSLTVYIMGPQYGRLFNVLLYLLTGMPLVMAYSYISMYYAIPKAFESGRFFWLIIYFVSATFVFAVLYKLSINHIYYRFVEPENFRETGLIRFSSIASTIIWVNVPFLMFASAKLIRDYLFETKNKNELENKNTEAEISLLATQLHPHFLFNTLNNLYSLSLSGSPKTAISLQKINGLMKYILFECGQAEISIKKEINLIDNYLELEKLRYDKRLRLTFVNEVRNDALLIAPMILFTFVENCFKHGSSKATGSSYIDIRLSTEGRSLIFEAENSIPFSDDNAKTAHSGLGLENVKKRLAFLYPDKHELFIYKENGVFRVELRIDNLQI